MEVSDLVRSLLAKRGIESDGDVAAFLNPDYGAHTHAPALFPDMDRAVARTLAAIARNERVAVYADFDSDGIPGAALLSDLFAKIGYGNVEVYIPHRDREGHGFHAEAVREIASRGASLIITVDVGTTACDTAASAKTLGVDVIITDHHELQNALPDAVAVLNPKRSPYPFPHLCGAAVAFKFAQALLAEGRRRGLGGFAEVPEGWEKWLLDLVAIATIADMVPLVGENRVLARYGLMVLRKSPRPGIRALVNRLRLRQEELTEDDVSFSFAPRINAASRMDDPDLAFRLLTTRDGNEAEHLAAHLEQLNTRRKAAVAVIVRDVKRRVRDRFGGGERVVVLGDTEWKPSLLGLAANSVIEERGGIVCLWGRDAQGRLKGSCRSDGALSVVELFSRAGDAVLEFGGHAASGGFSVAHERVHDLPGALARAAENIESAASAARARSESDAQTGLSGVSPALLRDISALAPFGMGNPKPVFRIVNAMIAEVRRFGRDSNHVEVMLACAQSGASARAFDFFKSPESFSLTPAPGLAAHVLATIERDSYRGGIALRIVDIVSAG